MSRCIHVLSRQGRTCKVWAAAFFIWCAIVLFSSTSLAGKASDAAFSGFFVAHLRRYDSYDLYHRYQVHFLAEKSVHIIMFMVLALLLWRVLPGMPGKGGTVFLCGALIGCCSELAQVLFPGRDPALRDVLINILGTGIGTAFSFSRSGFQR